MRLRFRSVLFAVTIILMTASLGAVAAFVLIRNNESSRAISTLQINQAATDVEERIARFLERGPQALERMQRLVNGNVLNLYDADRLEAYLIAEMRADRDLKWLSFSNAQTGAFIGVTHRDGMLILNRAALETDGGRPRDRISPSRYEGNPFRREVPIAAAVKQSRTDREDTIMRAYMVTGMTCGGCEKAVTRSIQKQLGEDIAVEADARKGEVRVSESADPQIVSFAIEGAGYTVEKVG